MEILQKYQYDDEQNEKVFEIRLFYKDKKIFFVKDCPLNEENEAFVLPLNNEAKEFLRAVTAYLD